MSDAQRLALGAAVRWVLLFAFAGLSQHKVVDGPILGAAVNDLTAQIVGWLGAGGIAIWTMLDKWWTSRKIATARVMPPKSTPAELTAVFKQTSPGLIPTGPLPTAKEAATIVAEIPATSEKP